MFAGKLSLPSRSRTFIVMYLSCQPLPKEGRRFDIRSPALDSQEDLVSREYLT